MTVATRIALLLINVGTEILRPPEATYIIVAADGRREPKNHPAANEDIFINHFLHKMLSVMPLWA